MQPFPAARWRNRHNGAVTSRWWRSEEHTSELQSRDSISYAVFCAGRAGVQILSKAQIDGAKHLLIAADVNAVPPPGVEGLGIQANGDPLTPNGAGGVGPLAIGNIKYKTEFALFQKMIAATKPVQFDFRDAFMLARELNV